ncbi:hypothetical protein, partial [Pseudomonas sp. RIT-PI-S]|uniref:hypothetical protein n=1 Tax=Pseudomonas sp. RIT-PI-S TaxID=3035295 RepID=UPI0021D9E841
MDNRNPGQHWQSTTPPHRPTPFKQSSHAPHCLAVAVVLALGTLVAERAEAGGSCPGTHTVINGATTSACTLGSAASVNVTEQGAIEPTSGTAIGVVGTAAGQVRNAGTLKGNTGIGLSGNDAGGGSLSGKLYNTATGHITADFGVHVANSQIAGSVTNAGSISSGAEDGAGMLFENARVGGNLSNTGNISVGFGAQGLTVLDSSLDGDLVNSGAISGGATGLRVANAIIDGSVRNAGSLAGGSNPLLVTGSFIRGDLVNSGSTGGTAALFDSTVLGRFVNSGSMSDGVTALRIQNMTISGGIVNTGEINSGEGVSITNSRFSSLHNSGTFYVSSGNLGLSNNTITGSIVNSGWLGSGTDGYGALALYGGVVGGEVKNTGTLDGGNFGVALRGEQDAFVFGSIINSGSMLAQTAVKLTATHIGGSFINTGSIVGNRDFIERQGSGVVLALSDIHDDFLNRGSISGLTRAVQLSEVKISGNFINRGSLVAPHGAVALNKANVVGSFSNYGHIGTELTPNTDPDDYDPNSRGLQISSSTLEGPLTNQGSIVGSSIGVEVLGSTLSQGLVNAGLLKGDAYSLYISPGSQVNGLYIAGNNTARFAGAVYAPGTTAYLYSNATYT